MVFGCVHRSASDRPGKPGRSWFTRRNRSGAVAVEFAIVAVPFFLWLLFIFELCFDLFTQVALDNALHDAVRQIQTGNAQFLANGQAFINGYLCPALNGRLICSNLYVNVSGPVFGTGQDYYNFTTGAVPTNGNTLDLSNYSGAASFCNAQPTQFMLVSAIYVGPTFLGGLLPGLMSLQYNGTTVHATLSTTGIVLEPYSPGTYTGTTPIAAQCP